MRFVDNYFLWEQLRIMERKWRDKGLAIITDNIVRGR
jgi:hypothetical protein